jgi:hypothetical protein
MVTRSPDPIAEAVSADPHSGGCSAPTPSMVPGVRAGPQRDPTPHATPRDRPNPRAAPCAHRRPWNTPVSAQAMVPGGSVRKNTARRTRAGQVARREAQERTSGSCPRYADGAFQRFLARAPCAASASARSTARMRSSSSWNYSSVTLDTSLGRGGGHERGGSRASADEA